MTSTSNPDPREASAIPQTVEALSRYGQLAGDIAMQLTSPLEILVNLLYLAEAHVGDPAKVRAFLAEAQQHTETILRYHSTLISEYHTLQE